VFSEMEIALSFCPHIKQFAVTGTNGKTTVTALLGEILKTHYGKTKAIAAGNIGIPLSALVAKIKKAKAVALEVSSYQLEDSQYFKPSISCILNITPDHIDHYGTMAKYIKAKEKIFKFQTKKDFCIFNADDKKCFKLAKKCSAKKLFFSVKQKKDAYLSNGKVIFKFKRKTYKLTPPNLVGIHNLQNAMAAGLMALAGGIKPAAIAKAFKKFKGVEHRLEKIKTVKGITFINDSKATNVQSTLIALKSFANKKNIWLILGGQDKGGSYKPLSAEIKRKVKTILIVGKAAKKIEKQLKAIYPVTNVKTIKNAVKHCLKKADCGDICLLSPACASFDQFKNFEQRGWEFKRVLN
jgi:UDP-N-acetylmuramoylalanine--D-glutamate ligase